MEAKRSNQAERCGEGGVRGLLRQRESNSRARRRRPSRAQRPGRAQLKEGSGKRVPFDCNSNPRSVKVRKHSEKPAVCKSKDVSFALIFPWIRAPMRRPRKISDFS
jgi:hypothetical protein